MQNVLHGRLGYMSALDGMLGNYTEEDKRKAIDLLQEMRWAIVYITVPVIFRAVRNSA